MITASVVLYKTPREMTERLLRCIMQSAGVGMLYVVDNAPTPETAALFDGRERICYIANALNEGYGRAHNRAISMALAAGATYHLALNPDIYWDENCDVPALLREFMEAHPQCGLAMPRITWPDGRVQPLCKLLPRPSDLIRRRFLPHNAWNHACDSHFELHDSGYDIVMSVPSLSGCFMFMRCATLKQTGMFDPRFFLYAEDIDLCRRIGCVADTLFVHHVSVVHEYQRGSYKSLGLMLHHIASAVRYFNKWGWFNDPGRKRANALCLKQFAASQNPDALAPASHGKLAADIN